MKTSKKQALSAKKASRASILSGSSDLGPVDSEGAAIRPIAGGLGAELERVWVRHERWRAAEELRTSNQEHRREVREELAAAAAEVRPRWDQRRCNVCRLYKPVRGSKGMHVGTRTVWTCADCVKSR